MSETEDLPNRIAHILRENGPLLGKELAEHCPGISNLALWQASHTTEDIQASYFARYYLRYDVSREKLIRLSPSILRDFLSFTLLSLAGQREHVLTRHVLLSNTHREISLRKTAIARRVLRDVFANLSEAQQHKVCAFIAGDLAYFLGHEEPRESAALGEMVNGSDIDIIIVHDGLDEAVVAEIDRRMLAAKHFYLRRPDLRQEIDFICKSKEKTLGQFAYGNVSEKIASKIVFESLFIAGSIELYSELRDGLVSSGVEELIQSDFTLALAERHRAARELLTLPPGKLDANTQNLFFFSQERVEFD